VAIEHHPELRSGVNVVGDQITNNAVAGSIGVSYLAPETALAGLSGSP
jgi:hypothetical protein